MKRELLDEAYRKLKGSVYLDKTCPYLRYDIAIFENNNFDSKMSDILSAFDDEKKWTIFENRIIESIRAFTFPKSIEKERMNNTDSPVVISNVYSESVCVKEYNNFIDLSVEGHIIGVLWVLLIGHRIDESLYENCFGNRLNESLVFSDKRVSESPNLFKPYFEQYETWRNRGLEFAREMVNRKKNSVIISMLDLSRFYYNVNYSESLFNKITLADNETNEIKKINCLVYKILRQYSKILGVNDKTILPIGYLPSNILANAYLLNFDTKISACENTVFYGRYVDDIIIVTKLENSNQFKQKIKKNGISAICTFMLDLLEKENLIRIDSNENIHIVGYEGLEVQKNKFRFFYVDKNGYNTIIEKIKSDISHNTSEFNFLPENDISDIDEDILQFNREDTVNKLRSINSVSLDKYALSKAIGKNIMMSQFYEKKTIDRFVINLNQILNFKEIISNYTQWESILNYYVINKKWKRIDEFSAKIVSAIDEFDELTNKKDKYDYLKNDGIYSVGDSLIRYYFSCLTRSMSIAWGKEIYSLLNSVSSRFASFEKYSYFRKIYDLSEINNVRRYFCNSRMINRNLLPINIEECMSSFPPNDNSEKTVCFNQFDEYLLSKEKYSYSTFKAKYKPYITSPFEILYTNLIKEIKSNVASLMSDDLCLDYLCNEYSKNFNSRKIKFLDKYLKVEENNNGNVIISIISEKKTEFGKYRIAVANVKTNDGDIVDILKDKPRRISKRCREINRIINEAIRYRTDVLIFPEAYIPVKLLPVIQKKVYKHNMVIIGGLEHIKKKGSDLVYNITATLLPFVNNHVRYTIPFFHLKVYYAPDEEATIKDKGCVPVKGTSHTLFMWNDISFVPFCCYELTSLEQRSKFKKDADLVVGVEWNKDTKYFSNILESLSLDRCCFCAQSNVSNYGDSRIIQPTSSVKMNIAQIKGGINGTVIIDEIDVEALRKHKSTPYVHKETIEISDSFKPLPAGYFD